jgi:hypothetical protein
LGRQKESSRGDVDPEEREEDGDDDGDDDEEDDGS